MKRLFLFGAIILLGFSALYSQNTCTEQLRLTQRRFDDGMLDEIPLLLADCMKDGFTKEEKSNAYKLLIQTYLFSEEYDKADEVMIQFLREFPSYTIAVNDPKEFIDLYSTYRTDPIFKLEFLGGLSFCTPLPVQLFGTGKISQVYTPKLGYNAELNYINTINKALNYSAGASVTLSNLGYSNTPADYATVTGTFTNLYIGLPVALRYNFNIAGISFLAKAGVEPVMLLNSKVDLTRTTNQAGKEPYTGTEDLLGMHNRFDLRPFAGLGIKVKLGTGQLMLLGSYKISTKNQVLFDERYSYETLMKKYYFIDDDLRLNHTSVSLSYIKPIYKPKKIK